MTQSSATSRPPWPRHSNAVMADPPPTRASPALRSRTRWGSWSDPAQTNASNSPKEITMSDLFENPMGLMGFEFVEFASPAPNVLEPVLGTLGFSKVAVHRSKAVALYRQGDINFIVNNEPKGQAHYFAAEHGPSACAMAFRV